MAMSLDIGGFDVAGPYRLDRWVPPHEAGVYAVLRRTAADGTPSFTPVYIGETDDFAADAFRTGHPRYACWLKETGAEARTYIGVIYTPGDTKFLRKLVQDALLTWFHPVCNYDWPHRWALAKEMDVATHASRG
jgi:hypothetical protein